MNPYEDLLAAYRDLARGYSQGAPGLITHASMRIAKIEKENAAFFSGQKLIYSTNKSLVTGLRDVQIQLAALLDTIQAVLCQ